MEARRSIRHFTTEEVAADVLDAIVEMAASGPMGVPPWDVGCVVVRGREKVQQLAGDIIRGYEGFLRRLGPWVLALLQPFAGRATHERVRHFVRPLAEMLVRQRKLGRDALFWGAPAAMIFHHSPYADRADAAIACTYAMLAAESLGLGTTMIGSAGPVLRRDPGLLRSWGIPEGSRPALVLILGYPAVQFRRTVRRHFTAVAQK
jgi:nitroreductase